MMVFVGNSTNAFYERSLTRMGNLRNSLEELQTQIDRGALRANPKSKRPRSSSLRGRLCACLPV